MRAPLGQHFLKDRGVARASIEALELAPHDTAIEIGPGRGALTRGLIASLAGGGTLVAIEKDPVLARELAREFEFLITDFETISNDRISSTPRILIQGDALTILPSLLSSYALKAIGYKLVGNIPYYITGKLLRILGESEAPPEIAVLMVQEEVAERMCATPPKMNLLAATVQAWAEPAIIMRVPREMFQPAPQVDSAVVRLRARIRTDTAANLREYYETVRALFKQPRKTMLNNLKSKFQNPNFKTNVEILEALKEAGINPEDRAQILDAARITRLAQVLYNKE